MTDIKLRVPLFALMSPKSRRSLVVKLNELDQLAVPLFTSMDYAKDFMARSGLSEAIFEMMNFVAVFDFLHSNSVPKQFTIIFDPVELGKGDCIELGRDELVYQITKLLGA